jgi:diguanylate cyclase (GGDEF)-like protein/excisionase family DNA binding protein
MTERYISEIPRDVRARIATAIRGHEGALIADVSRALNSSSPAETVDWQAPAAAVVALFASTTQAGGLDTGDGVLEDLCRLMRAMPTRQVVHTIRVAEGIVIDGLTLDAAIGTTRERCAATAQAIRSAALEIVAAYAERSGSNPGVRDPLTTLISPPVFDLALELETARASRYERPMSLLLFDIDNLSEVNAGQGYGAGDRLLERLGILARQFFRHHDWVARYGGDAIAVLLPETALDKAAVLATRFRKMVEERLRLVDHKTDVVMRVTVSAAAVGTEFGRGEVDSRHVLAEAEAAVLRSKMDGGNRTERVALLPTSVTILGAATLLGIRARHVVTLMRDGALRAARRGRHFHIDRAQIEEYKRLRERRA